MIGVSWLEVIIALVLVAVIGGGGFTLGCMIGTDRAEQRQGDEAERRLAARPPRPPVTARPYRPPLPGRLVALAIEADTAPMRVVPAITAAVSHTLAGLAGRHPQTGHGEHHAATSPASMELAVTLAAQRTELEISELIRHAEWKIGNLRQQPPYTQEGTR